MEVGTQEGIQLLVGRVVEVLAFKLTTKHDGLHHALAIEALEVGNDTFGETVGRNRAVNGNKGAGNGTGELEDIVVPLEQGFHPLGLTGHGRIAEDRNLGVGEILGAQAQDVLDHLLELGVQCGLSVAREGDDIERLALLLHLLEFVLELFFDSFP